MRKLLIKLFAPSPSKVALWVFLVIMIPLAISIAIGNGYWGFSIFQWSLVGLFLIVIFIAFGYFNWYPLTEKERKDLL